AWFHASCGPSRSLPRHGNAPGQFADLDGLNHLQAGNVDDRNIVRYAVGGEEILLVRRERHVPHPLPDQEIFRYLVRGGVDHGNAIGGTERDEGGLAIAGDADADRLDCLLAQAGDIERDLLFHLVLGWVDHADGGADLGRYPDLGTVALELGEARARIDQHVGDDPARLRVDEMRHVGRFRRVDQDATVRAQPHALGLDADLHVAER